MRLHPIFALIAGTVAAIALAHAQTLQLGTYRYTAQTAAASRVQGNVVAGGITWACQGSVCSTSGPWPRPAPEACRALADQVGRITAYGHATATLSAADLATCNAGQVAQALPTPRLPVPLGPLRRGPITTPEIALVGGAIAAPVARTPTLTTTTGEIHLVGGAIAAPAARLPTVTVETAEISLVGR